MLGFYFLVSEFETISVPDHGVSSPHDCPCVSEKTHAAPLVFLDAQSRCSYGIAHRGFPKSYFRAMRMALVVSQQVTTNVLRRLSRRGKSFVCLCWSPSSNSSTSIWKKAKRKGAGPFGRRPD